MSLETMTPDPEWDPAAHDAAMETVRDVADRVSVSIWCGDWCGDCRRLLPPFAAAIDEIALPESAVHVYSVEKRSDGSKVGERVEEYAVERTPTVILELDGTEVARFEEGRTEGPILESLADQLADHEVDAGEA